MTDALARLDVSRETRERLEILAALTAKWTPKINLIARSTIPEIWTRHILDSAQIWRLKPEICGEWADLGAGGGFPGLVIGAFAADEAPDMALTLVESDTRKTVFLQTAAQEMGLKIRIERKRIEAAELPPQDVISARALASLDKLLAFAAPLAGPNATLLFPKGAAAESELTEARATWHIECRRHPSMSDPAGCILEISEFSRVGETR
ncbi:16S rRNA (guanine(527)-N(7))-methyltransferase RsmG [Rhodovulum sp. DZ06]|uniref:16S rRNA (guanine(527)-N(7))-methyltransferase RsmG n=1 Tax=Rhodovulum sp. DZ06 TaxID=3425126 RepID=UPI003D328A17